MVAACHSYGEPVPVAISKGWDYTENPLIAQMSEDKAKIWSLFRGATLWLPFPDSFLFLAPSPTGKQARIATTAGLRKKLGKLNVLAWQADESTICGWSQTEGYPVDGDMGEDGILTRTDISENTQYDTQLLAKFAFSIF